MIITSDQRHVFRTSTRWRDFRALFPTLEEAVEAHAILSQEEVPEGRATHEIEWRLIFHSNASKKKQLLSLFLVPLGVVRVHHTQIRFKTRHVFSQRDALRIKAWRSLGSLCYYLCFLAIIGFGIGLIYPIIEQAFRGVSFKMMSLLIGSLAAIVALLTAAAKTRSIGLSGPLKSTAKDAFDLLSIRKLN